MTWLTTPEARRLLCTTTIDSRQATPDVREVVRMQSLSPNGKGPRGNGWLWNREDCEQLMQVKRKYGFRTINDAAKAILYARASNG